MERKTLILFIADNIDLLRGHRAQNKMQAYAWAMRLSFAELIGGVRAICTRFNKQMPVNEDDIRDDFSDYTAPSTAKTRKQAEFIYHEEDKVIDVIQAKSGRYQ
jgi:hypothetical protein